MLILEGLQQEKNMTIDKSLKGILEFLKTELPDETKDDYFTRKFRESKTVYSIGFDSINPVKLSIKKVYNTAELSDSIIRHNDFFHPLFYGYNITNNQYRKLEGEGVDKISQKNNTNAFSDYYISRKVLDKVLPHKIELSSEDKIDGGPIKNEILNEFYEEFNTVAAHLREKEEENVGSDFFIDFNTVLDLEIDGETKEQFVEKLLSEYGIWIPINYTDLHDKRLLNGYVYLTESISFMAKKFFDIEFINKDIGEILSEEVNLTFEVPTAEKPILKKSRNALVKDRDDLPKLAFVEMILLRYLVVMINIQGTTHKSGYRFRLKEGNDKNVTLVRKIQVVSDNKGNFSLNEIEYINLKEIEELKQRIKDCYAHYYPRNVELQDKEAEDMLGKKFFYVMNVFHSKQPQEVELLKKFYNEKKYRSLGKKFLDSSFTNIEKRVVDYEGTKGLITGRDLVDLLFVIDVTLDINKIRERMSFMGNRVDVKMLIEKEDATSEEVHYVLGRTAAMVVKDSRNKDSLVGRYMSFGRTRDIMDGITKRLESGYNEIQSVDYVSNNMDFIWKNIQSLLEKKMMSSEDKFSYVSGFMSGLRTYVKNTNENKEEK